MDADDVPAMRARLVARRDELLDAGQIDIDPNRSDPTAKTDEDAQPLNEMNQVIASRRNKARALELQRVEAALQRLERDPDEFGLCLECGEDIPPKRLEVMPWALYCVECQTERSPARGKRRRHAADFLD